MKTRGRSGPRPNAWKVKGELNHTQYIAWHKMRSQAHFRGEDYLLTFEDFQTLWRDYWHLRGREEGCWCLTRLDPEKAWSLDNVECMPRKKSLAKANTYKALRRRINNV